MKIIAINKIHLQKLLFQEINKSGPFCDLNHIDTSSITDMSFLFSESNFNGNISNWDVSNVTDMQWTFSKSKFNQDISNWNIENVIEMYETFSEDALNKPWWYIEDNEIRKSAIEKNKLTKQLNKELFENNSQVKKMKI